MNPTAIWIAVLYGAVSLIAIVVVVLVWRSTHRRRPVDTHRLAEGEKIWFGTAIVLLAILLFATIFFTPYGESAPPDAQVVRVEGIQFGWIIRPANIEAGRPIEFRIRARDVNHGFAVYNDDDTLLFQVQAVPDHDTNVVYTFKKAGTYRVLCFEFCGVQHQSMQGSFTVNAPA